MAAALRSIGWSVRRNPSCTRSLPWPAVLPELSYPGTISLQPVDSFPPPSAVFTDGSILQSGGAAAVQPDTEIAVSVRVDRPRSSTHCELVALGLGLRLDPPPPLLLTDSLVSLQLLQSWGPAPLVESSAVQIVRRYAGSWHSRPRGRWCQDSRR